MARSGTRQSQASRAVRRASRGGILGGAQLAAVAQLVAGGSRIKGAVLQVGARAGKGWCQVSSRARDIMHDAAAFGQHRQAGA